MLHGGLKDPAQKLAPASPAISRSLNSVRTEWSNPGSASSSPRRYFQSSRPRRASAACRSESSSANCMTDTSASLPGDTPASPCSDTARRSPRPGRVRPTRLGSASPGCLSGTQPVPPGPSPQEPRRPSWCAETPTPSPNTTSAFTTTTGHEGRRHVQAPDSPTVSLCRRGRVDFESWQAVGDCDEFDVVTPLLGPVLVGQRPAFDLCPLAPPSVPGDTVWHIPQGLRGTVRGMVVDERITAGPTGTQPSEGRMRHAWRHLLPQPATAHIRAESGESGHLAEPGEVDADQILPTGLPPTTTTKFRRQEPVLSRPRPDHPPQPAPLTYRAVLRGDRPRATRGSGATALRPCPLQALQRCRRLLRPAQAVSCHRDTARRVRCWLRGGTPRRPQGAPGPFRQVAGVRWSECVSPAL